MRFTGAGRLGYLRHILRDPKLPTDELLAAHLKQARSAHEAAGDERLVRRSRAGSDRTAEG